MVTCQRNLGSVGIKKKFVNIRYIFLLARWAYSWLFQLAQMWKLLALGVGLGDLLTPDVYVKFVSERQFTHG